MARRRRTAPSGTRRTRRKTDSGEETQKDPVIEKPRVVVPVPALDKAEIINEADALSASVDFGAEEIEVPEEAPAETSEPPKEPGKFDHIDRKYFNDEWIRIHHKNPADIQAIFRSIKQEHAVLRASGSPGTEDRVRIAREKLEELRAILTALGYTV